MKHRVCGQLHETLPLTRQANRIPVCLTRVEIFICLSLIVEI